MGRGKSTPLIKNGIDHRRKKNCSICKAIYFKKVLINEKQWLESIYCSRECKRQWQIGRPHPVTNRRKMTESEKLYGRSIGRWSGWNKGFKHSEETKRKISAGHQGITVKEWSGYIVKKDRLERHRFRNEIQKRFLNGTTMFAKYVLFAEDYCK